MGLLPMTVITLPARRTQVPQDRVKQILATLELDFRHVLDGSEYDPKTHSLTVAADDMPLFDEVFRAFMVPTPEDHGVESMLLAVSYLRRKLGKAVQLRLDDSAEYLLHFNSLGKLEQQFVDSLFQEDVNKPPPLVKRIFSAKLRSKAFHL